MRANRKWKRKLSNDQKLNVTAVVVITKNQDKKIVPPSGKDAIIAASSGIFLGLAEAGEVKPAEANLNDGKPTS